jgi:hypothetical protein
MKTYMTLRRVVRLRRKAWWPPFSVHTLRDPDNELVVPVQMVEVSCWFPPRWAKTIAQWLQLPKGGEGS